MASGILGQAAPLSTTLTTVYTVPASTLAVVNINVLNRSTSATADVRIALATTAASPTIGEYIEYEATVPVRGVLERTGIALQAGKNVVVYSSTANCSVSVYGLEQAV
jgi:hypothetical protein